MRSGRPSVLSSSRASSGREVSRWSSAPVSVSVSCIASGLARSVCPVVDQVRSRFRPLCKLRRCVWESYMCGGIVPYPIMRARAPRPLVAVISRIIAARRGAWILSFVLILSR